jgi:hypothetical protein
MSTTKIAGLVALAAIVLALFVPVGFIDAATQKATGPSLASIQVLFKLDPRITKGMYMGDRWVSPPTYTLVGDEQKCIVSAQATGLDAQNKEVAVSPTWKPGKASMVQVSPAQGNKVEITVLQEGQTDLTVAYGKVSKKLTVKSTRQNGVLRVDITQ